MFTRWMSASDSRRTASARAVGLLRAAEVIHLYHRGILHRVSVRDDTSAVNHKSRARGLFLLQPLPWQGPVWHIVRAVDLWGMDKR